MNNKKVPFRKEIGLIFLSLLAAICLNCSREIEVPETKLAPSFNKIVTGSLVNTDIKTASGIVKSYKNPGYYWVHNDSGDSARVFLIDSLGSIKTTVYLKDKVNRDWEDISSYKDSVSGKSYVYIADVGDNHIQSRYKNVYRFEETLESEVMTGAQTIEAQQVTFEYLDGLRDAETLLVDPLNGEITIVSKREEQVKLYTFPSNFSWGDTLVLESKVSLKVGGIVGGDISSNSKEILLKNYQQVYYWKRENNESIATALEKPFQQIEYSPENQGEAIGWSYNDKDFYIVSECLPGLDCNINFYKRN